MIERAFIGLTLLAFTGWLWRHELEKWYGALGALGSYCFVLWLLTP